MRRLLTAALALALATQTAAADFARAPSAPSRAPTGAPIDATHMEALPRVQAPPLPARTRARLRKVLAARRATNLAAFRAYVRAGRYPINTVTHDALNIWIDDGGRRCAAAQMIWASGAHALVEATAAEDNFIRLANVTDGPLRDWILTSGLTHDEIVLIQRPFVGRPLRPERPAVDWKTAAPRAMRAKYAGILVELDRERAASLDAALDALTDRPDLVATLLGA